MTMHTHGSASTSDGDTIAPSAAISIIENSTGPIIDLDCGVGTNPDAGMDICMMTHKEMNGFGEDTDKPTSYILSLGDLSATLVSSATGDALDKVKSKVEVGPVNTAADDGDGNYYIVVSDESDATKAAADAGSAFFSGAVEQGDSFTASGSFGSETFVHIFSSDGGALLQTVNYHTSCSSPLIIGDQYGSVTLEGATLIGKDSNTPYTVGLDEAKGDDGVVYSIDESYGDGALFTVNDKGEVTFITAPDFENPLDTDGDNNYDVKVICTKDDGTVEEKIIEVCVEDECISIIENSTGPIIDLDCGVGTNPDAGMDICMMTHKEMNGFGEDTDKPTSYILSLGDLSATLVSSATGDALDKVKSKVEVGPVNTAADDGDGNYYIVVSDESDATKAAADAGSAFFSGAVEQGDSFTASGSFGSETFVHIFSSDGGALLQTVNYHTSCSSPLIIGDQYGSVTLEGATLIGKDSNTPYTVGLDEAKGDDGVVYSIDESYGDGALFTVNDKGEVTFITAPDFENPLDTDGDNNYDVKVICTKDDGTVEEKIIEVCVEDECISIIENSTGPIIDLDCGVGTNPDAGMDICMMTHKEMNGFGEDTDKPTSYILSLGDLSATLVSSATGDALDKVKSKVEVGPVNTAADDGDGNYYIVVSDESDATKAAADAGSAFFSGAVEQGDSFTASGSFGSETFVHIFSSDGGALLQTVNYHTSCSSPLIIGDQYGSVTLEGATLIGKDSNTPYTVGLDEAKGDDGVVYSIDESYGDGALFTVNDKGEVTFITAPDFENPLDTDGDNNYDVKVICTKDDGTVEEKIIEVCVEDVLDKVCIDENTTPVVDLDLKVECPVAVAKDIGLEICAEIDRLKDEEGIELEKPSELTLTLGDSLSTTPSSVQPDGKSSVSAIFAAEDGDGDLFIRVTDDDDATKLDTVYFEGAVSFGDSFTALASNAGDDKFSSNTYVHIFDDDGTLLQTIQYHTSCSAPILIGDQVGSVTVSAVGLPDKDTGEVMTFGGTTTTIEELGEGDITYSIVGGADEALFTVDPETGELSFTNAPDFETPLDDGADNIYDVIVRATAKSDPDCFTDAPIEVCVKDVPELGALSGRYFCDDNGNGIEDAGDSPIAGKTVILLRDGVQVDTTVTTTDGTYRFDDLQAGSYSVLFESSAADGKAFIAPNVGSDDAVDSDVVDPATGATAPVEVFEGQETTDLDAGVVALPASLSGRYFCDENDDNLDNGEPGIVGALVELLDAAGNVVATTNTDTNGAYSFSGLEAGTYAVRFAPDATGKTFVDQDAGNNANDADDSDVDPTTGTTRPITLMAGEDKTDVDAGVEDPGTASVGDTVWFDANGNGLLDAGEAGVAGIAVTLTGAGADSLFGTADDVTTSDVTDGTGAYLFDGLDAGTYKVTFDASTTGGLVFTTEGADADDVTNNDSDADVATGVTEAFHLSIGEAERDIDAGLVDPGTASITGRLFCDENDDSVDNGEPGVSNVTVELLDDAGNVIATATTAADGSYEFTGLEAGDYSVRFPTEVGGKILVDSNVGGDDTIDSDADQTTGETGTISLDVGERSEDNDAGIEDPGTAALKGRYFCDENDNDLDDAEPGIANIRVVLLTATGVFLAETTTAQDGSYEFLGLDAGDYKVQFAADPSGKTFVAQDAGNNGNDTVDSDVNPSTGETGVISIAIGEVVENVDAGVEDPGTAALGDKVFLDLNGNGVQDPGEAGVEGVTVQLLDAAGGVIDSTTTNAGGEYLFDGLDAGTYSVMFVEPDDFDFTTANVGDDTLDSDANPADGKTQQVTLSIGETNLTLDAGLVIENGTPTPMDDMGMICTDEILSIAVLDNDSDPENDSLTVTAVNGIAILDGETITIDAVEITLTGGLLSFDGEVAYVDLDIGEKAEVTYTYTVSDGSGGFADANVDVTFCGTANSYDSFAQSFPATGTYQIRADNIALPVEGDAYAIAIDGTGDARLDGVVFEQAYCLSIFDPALGAEDLADALVFGANILSGTDGAAFDNTPVAQVSIANGQTAANNLDLVNWLIAQGFEGSNANAVDGDFSGWEVQRAIWELTDNVDTDYLSAIDPGFGDNADVDFLVAAALDPANEGYLPGTDGIVTLIVDPLAPTSTNSQPFIIALNFEDNDCLC